MRAGLSHRECVCTAPLDTSLPRAGGCLSSSWQGVCTSQPELSFLTPGQGQAALSRSLFPLPAHLPPSPFTPWKTSCIPRPLPLLMTVWPCLSTPLLPHYSPTPSLHAAQYTPKAPEKLFPTVHFPGNGNICASLWPPPGPASPLPLDQEKQRVAPDPVEAQVPRCPASSASAGFREAAPGGSSRLPIAPPHFSQGGICQVSCFVYTFYFVYTVAHSRPKKGVWSSRAKTNHVSVFLKK